MDAKLELNTSSVEDDNDRKRGKKYTAHEKELLLKVLKRHPIIEDKRNDNNIITEKQEAWGLVTTEYNSDEKVEKREMANLKSLWKNVKIKAKKNRARHKKAMLKTRGGGGSAVPMDKMSEGITDLIPNQFAAIENEFEEGHNHIPETEDSQGQSLETSPMPPTSRPSTLSTSAETPSVLGERRFGKKRKIPSSTPIITNENAAVKLSSNDKEFHRMSMEYLKEEHDAKIRVHQHQLQFQTDQIRLQMERHKLQMEILRYQREYAIKQLHRGSCSQNYTDT